MRNESLIGDLVKMSLKKPSFGFAISAMFAIIGFFLKYKSSLTDLKPTAVMVLPIYNFFGTLSYLFALLILLLSVVGFIRFSTGSVFNKVVVTKPKREVSKFKTKDDYFKWKESQLGKSSNTAPLTLQMELHIIIVISNLKEKKKEVFCL